MCGLGVAEEKALIAQRRLMCSLSPGGVTILNSTALIPAADRPQSKRVPSIKILADGVVHGMVSSQVDPAANFVMQALGPSDPAPPPAPLTQPTPALRRRPPPPPPPTSRNSTRIGNSTGTGALAKLCTALQLKPTGCLVRVLGAGVATAAAFVCGGCALWCVCRRSYRPHNVVYSVPVNHQVGYTTPPRHRVGT